MILVRGLDLTNRAYRWLGLAIVLYVIALGYSLLVQAQAVRRGGRADVEPAPPGPSGPPPELAVDRAAPAGGMLTGVLIIAIVALMVVKPRSDGAGGYHRSRADRPRRPARCRTSPTSVSDLLARLDRRRPHRRRPRSVIDERRIRGDGHPRPRVDGGVQRGRGDGRGGPLARLGGEPGARRPLGEHPRRCTWPAARGEVHGFTVPAINIRAQTFDMARTILRRGRRPADVGAVIFELARSEQTYTFQRPIDYATAVLAGAIAAGWQHPVFIQGDHYQFNAKKYAADPEAMTEEIRRACRLALEAGYRNIDIDSSTLVDLSKPTVDEQQRENYVARRRADRAHPDRSSTDGGDGQRRRRDRRGRQEELDRGGAARLPRRLSAGARAAGAGRPGISKVSVQTGTSHGGVPLPGGGVAEVKLDFEVLRRLGEVAREYGLAGAVQHGASTLPDELFHRFPAVETAEIHLATGFQNALYEHPAFPAELHARDRGVGLRERRRRAQGRPDRPAVRLHDAQEGDRAVQARAVGPRRRRTRSSPRSTARSRSCSPSSA